MFYLHEVRHAGIGLVAHLIFEDSRAERQPRLQKHGRLHGISRRCGFSREGTQETSLFAHLLPVSQEFNHIRGLQVIPCPSDFPSIVSEQHPGLLYPPPTSIEPIASYLVLRLPLQHKD